MKLVAECELGTFAAIGPFSDELITGEWDAVVERFKSMDAIEAVQLLLAATRRNDAVVGDSELDELAEALGCFQED